MFKKLFFSSLFFLLPFYSYSTILVTENFNSNNKTTYDVSPTGNSSGDDFTLVSGSWNMYNCINMLNDASDKKNGASSARIKGATGQLVMNFNAASCGVLTFNVGVYGADAAGTLNLYKSTNNGSTWILVSTVSVATGALQSKSYTINESVPVRFKITNTTSSRLNVDDFVINNYAGGGGGGSSNNETEPNNTLFTSGVNSVQNVTTAYVGLINSSTDVDFFRVNFAKTVNNPLLIVELRVPSTKNYNCEIWLVNSAYPSGTVVASSSIATVGATDFVTYKTTTLSASDTLYIKVFGATSSDWDASLTYTLFVKTTANGKRFLFDATKYSNAGAADWQVDGDGTESVPYYNPPGTFTTESKAQRIPTPSQINVTTTSVEGYWTGAASSWAIELAKMGHSVETLPSVENGNIAYGTNYVQDLSKYDVLISLEPNRFYTSSETTAILNFLNNGGGLIMVVDHQNSDRDGNGYDSPVIGNALFNAGAFGIVADNNTIATGSPACGSPNPTNDQPSTNINGNVGNDWDISYVMGTLSGYTSARPVQAMSFYSGTSLSVNTGINSNAKGLIWRTTGTNGSNTNLMAVMSKYGLGRIFVVGDSSVFEDITPGTNLGATYDGWNDCLAGTNGHKNIFLNASLWTAQWNP